jgi:hypothetical protein
MDLLTILFGCIIVLSHFGIGIALSVYFVHIVKDLFGWYNSTFVKTIAFITVFIGVLGIVIIFITYVVYGILELLEEFRDI